MRSASSNIGSIDLSLDVSGGLCMERRVSSTMTQHLSQRLSVSKCPSNYDNNDSSETASSNLKGMLWRCDRIDGITTNLLDHDKKQPCDLEQDR
jgi:hypothetical protein